MLADSLELLSIDGSAAISSEDHEVTHRPEGCVEVFV